MLPQHVRLARVPFSEKLGWLEDAHKLAEAICPFIGTAPFDIWPLPSAYEDF